MLGALVLGVALGARAAAAPLEWARFSVLTPAGRAEPEPAFLRSLKPLAYATHTMAKGDRGAAALAKACGTTLASLQASNGNELLLVGRGTRILVQNKEGMLYRVRGDGETLDEIVRHFRRDRAGARELKRKVVEANDLPGIALIDAYEFSPGERLLLPGIRMDFDTYRFPFAQPGWHRISSGFGNRMHPILHYRRMHEGLDLPKPYGTPVYPARTGRVTKAGWYSGYGNMIEVRHVDGWSTRYGHLSKIYVKVGQWVLRGHTLLGRVGNTGLSTGPHLHFEVRTPGGKAVNPRRKIGRR